jgi:threonine dehydrogenase-like Zn-dependent dehydrogenase
MKAIVYDSPRNFSYRETVDPTVNADEVLMRVHACGLCGTDLHIHVGEFGPRFPLLFGAGPTGQVLAQLIKLNGAARLVVAAPPGPKLDLVARLAADEVVPMDRQNNVLSESDSISIEDDQISYLFIPARERARFHLYAEAGTRNSE